MVAGLLIPTLFAYFGKKHNPTAALVSMLSGGIFTLILIFTSIEIISDVEPSIFGILISLLTFLLVKSINKGKSHG
jgi:SSS family solute:Na+ symporter